MPIGARNAKPLTEAVPYHQCVRIDPEDNIVGTRFIGDRLHQPNGAFYRTSKSPIAAVAEADCPNTSPFATIHDIIADTRLRASVGKKHINDRATTGAEH